MSMEFLAGFYLLMIVFLCVLMFVHGKWRFGCSRKRRRAVHGPRSYPFVGSLFSFWKNAPRQMDWYTEMIARSPTQTIVVERLGGVRTVVTANPANVEHIVRTQFENFPKGENFTTILHDLLGRGIFNADGDSWKLQRKIASHEFSTRSLRNFVVEVVGEASSRLIHIMDGYADMQDDGPAALRCMQDRRAARMDMQDVLQRLAFDNICKVAFGVETGFLDSSFPDSELARAFDLATNLSSLRSMEPISVLWKLKRFFNVGSERRLAEAVRVVHGFALDVVTTRMQEGGAAAGHHEDLLSRFMTAAGENSSEEFLRDIIVSFILAGRDTTSSALTWFFWLLSSHQPVEDAIYNEVMRITTGASGSGSNEPFSYEDLKSMQYLHAAICESMRLYPPVPINSRHALHDDMLPDGTMVGKGTRVTYHSYAMGRMPALWGPDCMQFKPQRWLDDSGSFVPENQFKYPVFHGGMRVCLGKEMAFIQMKYVAASVIRRFRVRPLGSGRAPRFIHSLTSRMAGGFPISIQSRNRNDDQSSSPNT